MLPNVGRRQRHLHANFIFSAADSVLCVLPWLLFASFCFASLAAPDLLLTCNNAVSLVRSSFGEVAQELMTQLLNPKPGLRLGARSFEELKRHRWFAVNGVDFEQLTKRQHPQSFSSLPRENTESVRNQRQ